MRYKKSGWASLIITILGFLLVAFDQGWLGAATQTLQTNQPGLYAVTRFVDGDTVEINMNGRTEKVRMIGVDTPETHKPSTPVQCYGPAASAYTKNTIGNNKVRLQADPLSTNRDRYNRLLRYVYLPDGRLLNELLIKNGYGFYYPHFKFSKMLQFAASQGLAQKDHKGLWGNCNPKPTKNGGFTTG